MWKASVSGWRVAANVYNERKIGILNVFLWRDALVCILLFKAFDFCKCICTRNFKTFLSNRSGYTYSIWETPPICLNPLTELFLGRKYNDIHHLPKSVNQHSSSLNYQGSLGDSAKHSSVHKSRSCLCCPASLRPLRGSYGTQKKPSLAENLSQKILELEKAVRASRTELALIIKALPKHLRDFF